MSVENNPIKWITALCAGGMLAGWLHRRARNSQAAEKASSCEEDHMYDVTEEDCRRMLLWRLEKRGR